MILFLPFYHKIGLPSWKHPHTCIKQLNTIPPHAHSFQTIFNSAQVEFDSTLECYISKIKSNIPSPDSRLLLFQGRRWASAVSGGIHKPGPDLRISKEYLDL